MTETMKCRTREPSPVWVVREGFLEEEICNLRSEELVEFNQAEVKGRSIGRGSILGREESVQKPWWEETLDFQGMNGAKNMTGGLAMGCGERLEGLQRPKSDL